jgi:hypothetical protein
LKQESGVKSIERFILISALFVVLFFLFFGMREKIGGAVAGGLVAYLNFMGIKEIISRALGRQDKIRFAIALLYVVKFLAILVIVYLLVTSKRFDMLGFLAGLSSLLIGILMEGIKRAIWEDGPPEADA